MKEFNAPIAAIPPADRAWPEYRAALIAMGIRSDVEQAVMIDGLDAPPEGTGDAHFKATTEQRAAFLHSIRPHLDRICAASLLSSAPPRRELDRHRGRETIRHHRCRKQP